MKFRSMLAAGLISAVAMSGAQVAQADTSIYTPNSHARVAQQGAQKQGTQQSRPTTEPGSFEGLSSNAGDTKDTLLAGSSDSRGNLDPKKVEQWLAIIGSVATLIATLGAAFMGAQHAR